MGQLTFQAYFERHFPVDLAAFVEAMPPSQRKHFMKSPESYSISMNYLVEPKLALHVIPIERRPYYAAALYFTSLMDQAMYKYREECYSYYRRLTNYPKLTGACPGACMYIAEPSMALERTNLFDVDPSDYIQSQYGVLFRNRLTLAPILKEGRDYFRKAFPAFLQSYFPEISEPELFYRRVFDDWQGVEAMPALRAQPKPVQGGFHLAAGWGPVVEVRPDAPQGDTTTLTLVDRFGAQLELDFSAITGSFAGCRLQKHHLVGQQSRPNVLNRLGGAPGRSLPTDSETVNVESIVCNKHMTSDDKGDLMIDWSGRSDYNSVSSLPLASQCVLHGYYINDQLAAICFARIPVTIFNEMPHFARPGR